MNASNGLGDFEETSNVGIKSFFDSSPPLKDAAEIKKKTEEFMQKNSFSEKTRRIVLVTSGGTTVPLEQRCVRYIDNFSSGHRGATSAEYFLRAGYAVVFLYREGTYQPFCRSLPNNPLLECLEVTKESNITVRPPYDQTVKKAISNSHVAISCGTLLKLSFTTIFEYLQNLQLIASSMSSLGSRALFYLAAAVSDFYVPWESMAVHKIQSSSGPLDMRLAQVPKMLLVLRRDWAPKAFCISFKLETDKEILLKKAGAALEKYNMNMVIANELLTRKEEVIVVTKAGNIVVQRDRTRADADVEEPLINLIVDEHSAACKSLE
ncbi:phosphopantothenate--cysteine ligase 2-like [Salvia miltiorrhiza]|uniref:phosphopantothenate--cysteine ligase 2-like n=1 Tax=Salvia miltiorrhiza TaxID=226208 RepID=UPI0025AC2F50|nr:phosphopantothenate--cysteine ligase 2-like [Salvia miltiorrhiza]XP_057767539.1 phosphopantothenate--cysteine ligase 2-like [Salvia miltiorrhiza]